MNITSNTKQLLQKLWNDATCIHDHHTDITINQSNQVEEAAFNNFTDNNEERRHVPPPKAPQQQTYIIGLTRDERIDNQKKNEGVHGTLAVRMKQEFVGAFIIFLV